MVTPATTRQARLEVRNLRKRFRGQGGAPVLISLC